MSKNSIILYGSGSSIIVEFEELCWRNQIEIQAIVTNLADVPPQTSLIVKLILCEKLSTLENPAGFLCPLFKPVNRFTAVREALGAGLTPYGLLSDPHNCLPQNFVSGTGGFVNKSVVIGAHSKIGDWVFINRGAALGHHLLLEDYVSIGPGVVTGGHVTIKRGALIGTGAVILPQKTVGKHAVVGAGAVVTKDVKDNTVVVGNPASVLKHNDSEF